MTVRVLHLTGSPTSDLYADLSRLYAADCLTAVSTSGRYEHHIADVSPDRTWRFPTDLTTKALTAAVPLAFSDAMRRIETLHPDVGVPQMFCLPGMTTYRAVFDLLGVPFLGNTADVMALGATKPRRRRSSRPMASTYPPVSCCAAATARPSPHRSLSNPPMPTTPSA